MDSGGWPLHDRLDLVNLNPQVCIHVEDAVALAKYLARADEARRALAGCSYVQLEVQ